MRFFTIIVVLISLQASSQNFQKNLMLKEPLRNKTAIKSVETFYYSSILGMQMANKIGIRKYGKSELLKFCNGVITESVSREVGKEEVTLYVYDENCLKEIIDSQFGITKLKYTANEVEVYTYTVNASEYDTYKVYELDSEGDIVKKTEYYSDGSYIYCEVYYDDKKEISNDECDLLTLKMNERREIDLRKFANNAENEVKVVEEVFGDSKSVYTYKGKLLQKEAYFVDDKFKYSWNFKYDQHGNWIERKVFFGKNLREIRVRKIDYSAH